MTFIVSDLDEMEEVLTTVLDAKQIYHSDKKTFSLSKVRFFDIGGIWVATMERESLSGRTYNYVAFKMRPKDSSLTWRIFLRHRALRHRPAWRHQPNGSRPAGDHGDLDVDVALRRSFDPA